MCDSIEDFECLTDGELTLTNRALPNHTLLYRNLINNTLLNQEIAKPYLSKPYSAKTEIKNPYYYLIFPVHPVTEVEDADFLISGGDAKVMR